MKSMCVLVLMALAFENVQSRIHHHRHHHNSVGSSNKGRSIGRAGKPPSISVTPTAPSGGGGHLGTLQSRPPCGEEELNDKWSTVMMPPHIDRNSFQVTTSDPYYSVGPVEAIGYNPPHRNITPCEMLFRKHMKEQYQESDQTPDATQESLEVIRLPVSYNEDKEWLPSDVE